MNTSGLNISKWYPAKFIYDALVLERNKNDGLGNISLTLSRRVTQQYVVEYLNLSYKSVHVTPNNFFEIFSNNSADAPEVVKPLERHVSSPKTISIVL